MSALQAASPRGVQTEAEGGVSPILATGILAPGTLDWHCSPRLRLAQSFCIEVPRAPGPPDPALISGHVDFHVSGLIMSLGEVWPLHLLF